MSRQIPWLRVFVEGVVIVVSILLAFGLQAWWDGVQEQEEAHAILLGLHDEYSGHRSEIERRRARWRMHEASLGRVLGAMGEKSFPGVAVMDTAIDHMIYVGTFDPASGNTEAVIASGQLELIENAELRSMLAKWQGVVDELRDNELFSRDFASNVIYPYLANRGVPVSRAYSVRGRLPPALMSDADADQLYRRLFAEREFQVLLTFRHEWYNVPEYEEALKFVDRLIDLIEHDLPE